MDSPQAAVIIDHPTAFQRAEALHLLRLGRERTERLLAAYAQGRIDMQGLFCARRGDRLVGAAWGQVIPGRTAFCWPARLVAGEGEETALRLQRAVDRYLDRVGVAVTQALLPVREGREATRLQQTGYRYLTDLDYLISFLDQVPTQPPDSGLQFAPVTASDLRRLTQLVERTYAESLDCAQVGGRRTTEEILRGYRETGVYRPDWWLLAVHEGCDVGCVLLADHPEQQACELIYLGLTPETRGRGWGLQITRYAQWMMRSVPRKQMVLALDTANWPAQAIYAAAGFERWDRRCVYVRTTDPRRTDAD